MAANSSVSDLSLYTTASNNLPAVVRWTCVSVAVLSLVLDSVSIHIMRLTKKIPTTVKMMCISILLAEILFLGTHLLFEILPHGILKVKLLQIRRGCIQTDWALAAVVALERLFAMVYPFLFVKVANKLVKVIIGCLFTLLSIRIGYYLISDVETELRNKQAIDIWTNSIIVFITAIIVLCYMKILFVNRRQLKNIQKDSAVIVRPKLLKATKVLLGVTVCFVITHFPLVLEDITSRRHERSLYFERYTFSLVFLNCISNSYFYIWRFKECRLIFLQCLSQVIRSKSLNKRTVLMRISVYDIVLPEAIV